MGFSYERKNAPGWVRSFLSHGAWTFASLWGYVRSHSDTEVAAFRNDMLAVVLWSADETKGAEKLRNNPYGWQYLGWAAFAPYYERYLAILRAEAREREAEWELETQHCCDPCDAWAAFEDAL